MSSPCRSELVHGAQQVVESKILHEVCDAGQKYICKLKKALYSWEYLGWKWVYRLLANDFDLSGKG